MQEQSFLHHRATMPEVLFNGDTQENVSINQGAFVGSLLF